MSACPIAGSSTISMLPSSATQRNSSSMHTDARGSRMRFRSFLRPRLVFMTIVSRRSSYHITVGCGLTFTFTVGSTTKRGSSRNVRTSSLSCKCTKAPPVPSPLPQSTQHRQAGTSVETWIYLRHEILRLPALRRSMPSVSLAVDRAPVIVALDAGTSSVRALAFDTLGRAIVGAEEQLPYALETTPDGGATFPAEPLFDLTVKAIDGAVARLGDAAAGVAAVGSTSFWHSLMGIDASGTPTTPVFYWADTRSSREATTLRTELDPSAIWQRTGCRLHSSYWPAKLRWLRRTDPDTFRRTTRWLSFAEYTLGQLCQDDAGAATICMASGTGLLDVHAMVWDAEMLEVSGIGPECLSPLVDLGPSGCLRAEFANRWPALATARWFPALGDGACANVGSGATGPSRIALTVGTSAAVRMILPRAPDQHWSVPAGLWAYRLDRDRAVLGGALSNGGNLLHWMWNTTGTDRDEETTAAAAALAPDATGLTFLPFLAGERSPGWHDDAAGVIAGLTLSTRPEHLLRAGMESVAYRLADVYDALRPLASPEHEIVASGGAILVMPSWLQVTADALGHTLIASTPGDESTARGAALMAAVEAGILPGIDAISDVAASTSQYAPDMANHELYRQGRARQARLEQALVRNGEF